MTVDIDQIISDFNELKIAGNSINELFIRNNLDSVDWIEISQNQNLNENLIREFKDYVDWTIVSICQKLSEDFIREFQDRIDWFGISQYQRLSENFIREFHDKVCWWNISENQELKSEKFFIEFKDKIEFGHLLFKLNYPFKMIPYFIFSSNPRKIKSKFNLFKNKKHCFDGNYIGSPIKKSKKFLYQIESDSFNSDILNEKEFNAIALKLILLRIFS